MKKGLIKDGGSWEVPTALANLKQCASYSSAIVVNDVPALTKTIMLYDLVSNTLLGEVEHWLVQGFPHPHSISHDLAKHFPFPGILQKGGEHFIKAIKQKAIAGNSMRWAQLGAWLLFFILPQSTFRTLRLQSVNLLQAPAHSW